MSNEFKVGDQVRILVGGPHENIGRIATVGQILEHNGNVVLYFGDQDEDEFVYSPNELVKIIGPRAAMISSYEGALGRVWALVDKWENATELSSGQPSIITRAFAAEVRKALEGEK